MKTLKMKEQLRHVQILQTPFPPHSSSGTMETSTKNIILRFHMAFYHFDIFKTIFFTLLEEIGSTSFSCNKIQKDLKLGVLKK